jgi:hypothetical protein
MVASLSDYKYNGVGLDQLLATTDPPVNKVDKISTTANHNIMNIHYNTNQTFYSTILPAFQSGLTSYKGTGGAINYIVPKWYAITETGETKNYNVSAYNKMAGLLYGGAGGGGGGGGSNRDGDNHNGGAGGAGQSGQLVQFKDIDISSHTTISVSTGAGGSKGNGGASHEYASGESGNNGGNGGDTMIKSGTTILVSAEGGGKGKGGKGGTDDGNGAGGAGGSGRASDSKNIHTQLDLDASRSGGSGGNGDPHLNANGTDSGNLDSDKRKGKAGSTGKPGSMIIFLMTT